MIPRGVSSLPYWDNLCKGCVSTGKITTSCSEVITSLVSPNNYWKNQKDKRNLLEHNFYTNMVVGLENDDPVETRWANTLTSNNLNKQHISHSNVSSLLNIFVQCHSTIPHHGQPVDTLAHCTPPPRDKTVKWQVGMPLSSSPLVLSFMPSRSPLVLN